MAHEEASRMKLQEILESKEFRHHKLQKVHPQICRMCQEWFRPRSTEREKLEICNRLNALLHKIFSEDWQFFTFERHSGVLNIVFCDGGTYNFYAAQRHSF